MSRCNKKSKCHHCTEDITVGEPEIFGKLWMKFGKEGGEIKRWSRKFHWHAQRKRDNQCCWLVQAMEEFAKRTHIETRGRKELVLPLEAKEARLRLLRRRAKIIQQLRVEMEKAPELRRVEEIIRLGMGLEKLKLNIEPLGGVPKSWM